MTNNEWFNLHFHENLTAEENAENMIRAKSKRGEITEATDVNGMRMAMIEWLNSEKGGKQDD